MNIVEAPSVAWAHRPSGSEEELGLNVPLLFKVIATGRNNSSFNCVLFEKRVQIKGLPSQMKMMNDLEDSALVMPKLVLINSTAHYEFSLSVHSTY